VTKAFCETEVSSVERVKNAFGKIHARGLPRKKAFGTGFSSKVEVEAILVVHGIIAPCFTVSWAATKL
jgi:hypothetical protein